MRVAVVTQREVTRGSGRYPAYSAWAEAEDTLIEATEADLVPVHLHIEHPRIRLRRQLGRTTRRLRGSEAKIPRLLWPGRAVRELSGRYDLIVFVAHSVWDLQHLERLDLRRYSDTVAAWFFETWPSAYTDGKTQYEPFHTVDHIFVALEAAVDPLAETLGRDVTYLPMATDTIRFGPEDPDLERPIDLIGIGGRRAEQHEAMLRWATERERFYLYDTTPVGRPHDYRQHRENIGHWYSTSRLAVCNFAKSHKPDVVGDLRIVPGRLWEGLAAGTGLVGVPPDEEVQRQLFGRTVVDPVPDDPGDLPDFLEELLLRHGTAQAAANVRLALGGHDWAHRWRSLLEQVGLPNPDRLDDRIDELARRAEKFA